jgi:hypothetical protein
MLNEKVTPGVWTSVVAGLIGVWVILHGADSSLTTLFYTALAGVLFCGGFLPFVAVVPNFAGGSLMFFLGLLGVASHFCLIPNPR